MSKSVSQSQASHVVIGDGWAALSAVGFLVQSGAPVVWIANTRARMFSALPSLDLQAIGGGVSGEGIELWQRLARGFGGSEAGLSPAAFPEAENAVSGAFLREFRNKAFRQPAWVQAPTPEARAEVRKELLWEPEQRLAPLWEGRFSLSLNEIEQRVRGLLTGDSEEGASWRALIRRIDEVPIQGFKIEGGKVQGVILGSGEEIVCSSVLYADRWDALSRVQGLPKNLPFVRGREPASVLQAHFVHDQPIGAGLMEGFYGALHRETGEDFERHVWGHFSSDGLQSYWTLCLTGEEVEDNHQIAKKLRRLKSALDKMFAGSSWLPEGKPEFMSHVTSEAVHFHESVVFADGEELAEPIRLPSAEGLQFLTDGYGPASALIQVARALELPSAEAGATEIVAYELGAPRLFELGEPGEQGSDAQAESVDFAGSSAS